MDFMWIITDVMGSALLLGYIYKAPDTSHVSDKALIDIFEQVSSHACASKLVAEDFNLPDMQWLPPSAITKHRGFLGRIKLERWAQHVTESIRSNHLLL